MATHDRRKDCMGYEAGGFNRPPEQVWPGYTRRDFLMDGLKVLFGVALGASFTAGGALVFDHDRPKDGNGKTPERSLDTLPRGWGDTDARMQLLEQYTDSEIQSFARGRLHIPVGAVLYAAPMDTKTAKTGQRLTTQKPTTIKNPLIIRDPQADPWLLVDGPKGASYLKIHTNDYHTSGNPSTGPKFEGSDGSTTLDSREDLDYVTAQVIFNDDYANVHGDSIVSFRLSGYTFGDLYGGRKKADLITMAKQAHFVELSQSVAST